MSVSKKVAELERRFQEIERLSGQFGVNINTANLKPLEENAEAINSIYRDLLQKQKEWNSEIDTSIKSFNDVLSTLKKSSSTMGQAKKALSGLNSIASKLQDNQRGYNDLSVKELQNLQNLAKAQQSKLSDAKNGLKDELIELQHQLKTQKDLIKEKEKTGGASKADYAELIKIQGSLRHIGKSYNEIRDLVNEKNAGLTSLNKELDNEISRTKEIEKRYGLIGMGVKSLQGFLNKIGASEISQAIGLEDANKKMRDLAKDGASTFQILKGGFASMGKSIVAGLSNPLTAAVGIFTFLYKKAMESDKLIGDMAKSMSITYEESRNLASEMGTFAENSRDVGVTQKGMMQALQGVNTELGTSGKLSNETLATMEKLNRYAGLNYQQQAQTLKTAMATGQSYEKYVKNVQGTIKLKKFENNLALNEKKIMLDINKAADSVKLSIAGGGEGLANAAVAAAKMGVNLNQVDKIAGSLLNFEESIKNELDAELLTGKDLNLEKARQLALNNDLAGVAEEVAKQMGSAEDFSKMNRIQQEAMAKAVGMTRDELAGALIEQEALKSVGSQLTDEQKEAYEARKKEIGAEAAAQELKDKGIETLMEEKSLADQRQAQQEKFEEALRRLGEALIPIFEMLFEIANAILPYMLVALEPIQIMFAGIAEILSGNIEDLSVMEGILGTIGVALIGMYGTYKLIKGMQAAQNALLVIRNTLTKSELAQQVLLKAQQLGTFMVGVGRYAVNAAASAAQTPIVGPILAIAAAAAAVAGGMALYNKFKGDDIMSPGEDSPGYGKRTLFGPEGAIQLNNKDTVIAGTNLFGDDTVSEPGKATEMKNEGEIKVKAEGGGGGGMDMSSVVSAISDLGAKIEALASRPIEVNADGNKIVEATTGARPIESGEEASKNAYKIQ